MKMQIKVLSIALSLLMLICLFTGCTTNKANKESDKQPTEKTDTVKDKEGEPSKAGLPLVDTLTTLRYWVPMHGSAAKIMKDYSEMKYT